MPPTWRPKPSPRRKSKSAFLLGNATFNKYILAISIGAVFFGANTYIGNGPNFMVKSIADHQKVRTPGFLAYVVKYTLPFLVPMLVAGLVAVLPPVNGLVRPKTSRSSRKNFFALGRHL